MPLGLDHPITDVCLLVASLDRSIAFYEKIGFRLRRRNEGFADFHSAGTTLALWESEHVREHVGLAAADPRQPVHKVMTALRVETPEIVDALYAELVAADISTLTPPRLHEWNAYCVYFADPDGNAWEIYSWKAEGPYGGGVPPKNRGL